MRFKEFGKGRKDAGQSEIPRGNDRKRAQWRQKQECKQGLERTLQNPEEERKDFPEALMPVMTRTNRDV